MAAVSLPSGPVTALHPETETVEDAGSVYRGVEGAETGGSSQNNCGTEGVLKGGIISSGETGKLVELDDRFV